MAPKHEVIVYWSDEDQVFVAEVPGLLGCAAHGHTPEDALRDAQEAMTLWLEAEREFSDPSPGARAADSLERIWADEAQRRYGEVQRGEVEPLDFDEAMKELRKRRRTDTSRSSRGGAGA